MAGKKFSDFIKSPRSDGKKFVKVRGLTINISPDSDKILVTELTKQRFLALCVYYVFISKEGKDFTSPLMSRTTFDDSSPLTVMKSILGGGLQFSGPIFKRVYKNEKEGILVIHTACIMMDYIRVTTPAKLSEGSAIGLSSNPKQYKDFMTFALSEDAADGEMLLAGSR